MGEMAATARSRRQARQGGERKCKEGGVAGEGQKSRGQGPRLTSMRATELWYCVVVREYLGVDDDRDDDDDEEEEEWRRIS